MIRTGLGEFDRGVPIWPWQKMNAQDAAHCIALGSPDITAGEV